MNHRTNLLSFFLFTIMASTGIGCANVERSMIFATGTTVGIDVSAEAGTPYPVRFVMGYRRAEILLDPVINGDISPDGSDAKIAEHSHSVLAKLTGRIDGGGGKGTQVNGGQWFAAGEAAIELAKHPQTAAALSNDPAGVSAVKSKALMNFPSESADYYEAVYRLLKAKADAKDSTASHHIGELNKFAKDTIQSLDDAALFSFNSPRVSDNGTIKQYVNVTDDFLGLTDMLNQANVSSNYLKDALKLSKNGSPAVDYSNSNIVSDQPGLETHIKLHKLLIDLLQQRLDSDQSVIDARRYVHELTRP